MVKEFIKHMCIGLIQVFLSILTSNIQCYEYNRTYSELKENTEVLAHPPAFNFRLLSGILEPTLRPTNMNTVTHITNASPMFFYILARIEFFIVTEKVLMVDKGGGRLLF